MKTAALSFFTASAVLAALLAACFNPITVVPPQGGESAADSPSAIPGGAGGAGIPDTGSFTVTIAVNPVSGGGDAGRAAAGLGSTAIQTGGVRNTFLLVALDEEGEVVESWEGNKEKPDSQDTTVDVTLPPGEYDFLLLLGYRERSYAAETGGKCVYKAGAPTLLAAGLEEHTIGTGSTSVEIKMKPVTVEAKFTSATLGGGTTVEAQAEGVVLGRGEDWELTWTVGAAGGLGELKAAQAAWGGSGDALFRNVTARRTDGTVAGFSSNARFDYGTDTDDTGKITLNLEGAPKGVLCAAWFNLEYAPFSLDKSKWDGETWVIRNGVNDLPQNDKTDFTPVVYDTTKYKMPWDIDGTKNGNGAVRFTLPLPLVDHLNLTLKVPKPVAGAVPIQAVADSQYTGTVRWENEDDEEPLFYGLFTKEIGYIAKVTLYALPGYTFDGLLKNSFSYTSKGFVTNPAGTGDSLEVIIGFWEVVTDLDLTDSITRNVFTSPTAMWTADSSQYTGSVTSCGPSDPVQLVEYTATVKLTAKPGYIFAGIPAKAQPEDTGGFTHDDATSVTHDAVTEDKEMTVTVVFPPPPANAEGGDVAVTKIENTVYEIHTFTTIGGSALEFNSTVTPPSNVDVLVVAGGGGSGGNASASYDFSGGGGAGGLLYQTDYSLTVGQDGSVPVVVGAGGNGGNFQARGSDGETSSIGTGGDALTVKGGGGGGNSTLAGRDGGSGGGGSNHGAGGKGETDQGNSGGAGGGYGTGGGTDAGGGGGGAGGPGGDASGSGHNTPGAGGAGWKPADNGAGWIKDITGVEEFSHGGKGGGPNETKADGKNYGDGGSAHKGGTSTGAKGHSGVVIVRWPYIYE